MAKEYKIIIDEDISEYEINAKGKNTIYLKGLEEDDIFEDSFYIEDDILYFNAGINDFIVSNYSGIRYIKVDTENKKTKTIDIIANCYVDNTQNIINKLEKPYYNSKKLTVTGTNYNDVIDFQNSDYTPVGTKNIQNNKGLTINGGNGNDEITGTTYNDIVNGGNGNDTIYAGKGNDTITGGIGENIIEYYTNDGNDVINLNKGENFTLNFNDLDIDDLRFEFTNKNKDLKIYTNINSDSEYITIKNFGAKDVTNNSNAKKKLEDTSTVEIQTTSGIYDLRNGILDDGTYLYKTKLGTNAKNYTGTWLNDEIDASNATLYKTQGKGKDKTTIEKLKTDAGLTLKGGLGKDSIIGSKYSDIIYGGADNDIINGGTGNDKLYGEAGENTFIFNLGDGADTVFSGKGKDTLKFVDVNRKNIKFAKGTGKNKNDLIIYYDGVIDDSSESKVTVKDYYKTDKNKQLTTSVKYIETDNGTVLLEDAIEQYEYYNNIETVYLPNQLDRLTINAGKGDDKIHGNADNCTIYGGLGNDEISIYGNGNTIYGGKGNDYINNYEETDTNNINTIVFNNGDGDDTLYFESGNAILKFADITNSSAIKLEKLGDDLILKYNSNKDSVKIRYYYGEYEYDIADYTIEYKNGTKISLNDFVSNYGTVPDAKITSITGTTTDDNISLSELSGLTIDAGKGDDDIHGGAYNCTIYGGLGNDEISIYGNGNTIYGGKGNDYINNYEETDTNNINTLVFFNGDGDDTLSFDSGEVIVNFANIANNSDIKFEKSNDNLILKYNSNKDSITFSGYYSNDYESAYESMTLEYIIKYKNGNTISLKDLVKVYGDIPESVITSITGTTTDDNISLSELSELTIDAGKGDDDIYGDAYNCTIYGGLGNDEIDIYGNGNTIYGGKGNDYINSWEEYQAESTNTIVFNNGDGDDTLYFEGSNAILKFADISNSSAIKLEKLGDDLILKYNSNKDSIKLSSYFYEEPPQYTIQYRTGSQELLTDFILNYGEIPDSKINSITGTTTDDYIRIPSNNTETSKKYTIGLDKKTVINRLNGEDDILNVDSENNINFLFNVDKDYDIGQGIEFGDIYILEDDYIDFWANNENYRGIVVKDNSIETINWNNMYISSSDIANLASEVSAWLITDSRNYDNVQAVLNSENPTDITNLLTFISENTNWVLND